VTAARTLRKLAAFFWRDFSIARGYRSALVLEIVEALFGVATFFFLSRFVESPELDRSLPAGSNYFAFALVGFAFFDYLSVAISAFDSSIEEARQNRTLEALLVTQTPLPVILAGSAAYPFAALALRTCVYLGWGALFFGFLPRTANWPGALLILLASILAFAGLGILSASYQILFKRGNPAKWVVLGVAVLPGPLRLLARLIPVTYSLEGMRAALLAGAGWGQLWRPLAALLIFAAVLIPVSIAIFGWALRRTKITGTLTHI
jgi:ABC-2 type transport system permease protein